MGLKEVDSEHLTTFRNQAMMKAVKRIRSFGYNELTFDAFDTALQKTKRLQGKRSGGKALQEIRSHFSDPEVKTGRWYFGRRTHGAVQKVFEGEGSL